MAVLKSDFKNNAPLWDTLKRLWRELGVYLGVGFGLALALLWLFGELSENIFAHEFASFDNNLALWIHSWNSSWLDLIFRFFTAIGGFVAVPILTALTFGWLVWRKKFYWGWLLVIGVAGGIAINQTLKLFYHRTRPDLWNVPQQLTSSSYPSGHATASFCFFGILLWMGLSLFKRPLLKVGWALLMIFMIVMVGLSRVYLGEHYPTDVIGAWLSSALWLVILLDGVFIYRHSRQKPARKTVTNNIEHL